MSKNELLFMKSCGENKPKEVQAFLNLAKTLEIDINAVDEFGATAAYKAAMLGHTEIIKILAATGLVDWNKGSLKSYTPLNVALAFGHSDVVGIIVKQDNINFTLQTHRAGWTLAIAAVFGGNITCVEILAKQENCDCWNIPNRDGVTPLMEIIRKKKMDVLKILLNCPRVDPNLKDQYGNSPVMEAIKMKESAMAIMMIKCPRVDLETKDRNGASLQRIARWKERKVNLIFDELIFEF